MREEEEEEGRGWVSFSSKDEGTEVKEEGGERRASRASGMFWRVERAGVSNSNFFFKYMMTCNEGPEKAATWVNAIKGVIEAKKSEVKYFSWVPAFFCSAPAKPQFLIYFLGSSSGRRGGIIHPRNSDRKARVVGARAEGEIKQGFFFHVE